MRTYTENICRELAGKVRDVLAKSGITIGPGVVEWNLESMIEEGMRSSGRNFILRNLFEPTDEDFQKIIRMNDGLRERFAMAWDQMVKMKHQIDSDRKTGKLDISGYELEVQFRLCYNYDEAGIPTANGAMLKKYSDATYMFPMMELRDEISELRDFERDILSNDDPKLSFSIEWLDYPELKNHFIYMYMHHIFQDSDTFCPMDIRYIRPEDLEWQITVNFEHFSKPLFSAPEEETNLPVTEHIKRYPWDYLCDFGDGKDYSDGIYDFIYYVAGALSADTEKKATLTHNRKKILIRGFGSDRIIRQMLDYCEHPFTITKDSDFFYNVGSNEPVMFLVVNMLSSYFKLEVYKDCKATQYIFKDGVLQSQSSFPAEEENGASVEYVYNPKYFSILCKYDSEILKRVRKKL